MINVSSFFPTGRLTLFESQPSCEERKKKERKKNGPRRETTCLREFANNTGADQPAHPRRLISAFFIRFLERIIC